MATNMDLGFVTDVFTNTTTFNVSWIFSLILVVLTLLIITRDTNTWKVLALPVTVLWHIAGVTPSILWYLITGILFVVEAMSLQTLGNVLSAFSNDKESKKAREVRIANKAYESRRKREWEQEDMGALINRINLKR